MLPARGCPLDDPPYVECDTAISEEFFHNLDDFDNHKSQGLLDPFIGGGPRCQGFSEAGTRAAGCASGHRSPRNMRLLPHSGRREPSGEQGKMGPTKRKTRSVLRPNGSRGNLGGCRQGRVGYPRR